MGVRQSSQPSRPRAPPKGLDLANSGKPTEIEEGAPADIFFSADLAWRDYLQERNLIVVDSRATLLGNQLVLVAPADSAIALTLAPGVNLLGALGADGKLATANVQSVPAGKYGRAALVSLGAWTAVEGRVAQADNVRAALAFVAEGEAPLGVVYTTDANAEPRVRVVGTFPDESHPPIVYPAALTAGSANPDAAAFLSFLASPAARAAFVEAGFTVLAPST